MGGLGSIFDDNEKTVNAIGSLFLSIFHSKITNWTLREIELPSCSDWSVFLGSQKGGPRNVDEFLLSPAAVLKFFAAVSA